MPLRRKDRPGELSILTEEQFRAKGYASSRKGVKLYCSLDGLNVADEQGRCYQARFFREALDEVVEERGRQEGLLSINEVEDVKRAISNSRLVRVSNTAFSDALIHECLDSFIYFLDERFDNGYYEGIKNVDFPEFLHKVNFSLNNDRQKKPLSKAEEQQAFHYFDLVRFKLRQALLSYLAWDNFSYKDYKMWKEMEQWVRGKIVEANLPLVFSAVSSELKKNGSQNHHFDTLMSSSQECLLNCVDKFDITRGYKFSTYAMNALKRRFIRTGQQQTKYRQRFPVEFDPDLEKSDRDDRKHAREEEHLIELIKRTLSDERGRLRENEKTILQMRYLQGMSLRRVGHHVGLSSERVRQIENSALDKMRFICEKALV
ncbi:MAG: sigma-70 family RNA polymerase sigma factor [Candidatus Nanoarchaeia archaeon]